VISLPLQQDDAEHNVRLAVAANLSQPGWNPSFTSPISRTSTGAPFRSATTTDRCRRYSSTDPVAHVDALIAEREIVAAGVGIAVLNGVEHLGQRDVHATNRSDWPRPGTDGLCTEGGDIVMPGLFQLTADEKSLAWAFELIEANSRRR